MHHLKKRFTSPSNKKYKKEYKKFMGDMMENDYTKKVPSNAGAKSGVKFAIDTRHAKRRS